MNRPTRVVDVLVVGAGPAGLAAAARLAATGVGTVEVLERERHPGGALRHCPRSGFALREPRQPVGGPALARRLAGAAVAAGAVVRTGVTATGWAGALTLDTTSPAGLERITARAVVLATGARERPRSARLVPGTRPAGVFTGGELQQAVYLYGQDVGTRAVVVGAEPVARHAVRALGRAGAEVAALVTTEPWPRPGAFAPGRLVAPVPVLGRTEVTGLLGRGRLSGVRLRHAGGRETTVACDTVVFTGDWIPEHELARHGGVVLDPGTRGPAVDAALRTSATGVFAVGDVLHGGEGASRAATEGRAVVAGVLAHLSGAAPWPGSRVAVVVDEPLRWVAPNLTGAVPGRFLVRAGRRLVRPVLVVAQDGVPLYRRRLPGTLTPSRSVSLPGAWVAGADPAGGPVRIGVGP
ncbi:FAD-dependent oxidoreductase [Streptomyces sp. HMX112]|uniref:FAD-dependent oxidoreductase n=1 Tax=Streptomyces sp. HMX112 TaxID=3390850 RepID=UPI003A8095CD